MFSHDAPDDVQVQLLVVADGDVAKTDHLPHAIGDRPWQELRALEQVERFARFLRNAEPLHANQVHRRVDGAFARALQIQDNGVLARLVGRQVLVIAGVFLANAPDRPLDRRGLVQQHVQIHVPPNAGRDSLLKIEADRIRDPAGRQHADIRIA